MNAIRPSDVSHANSTPVEEHAADMVTIALQHKEDMIMAFGGTRSSMEAATKLPQAQ